MRLDCPTVVDCMHVFPLLHCCNSLSKGSRTRRTTEDQPPKKSKRGISCSLEMPQLTCELYLPHESKKRSKWKPLCRKRLRGRSNRVDKQFVLEFNVALAELNEEWCLIAYSASLLRSQ